MAEAERERIRPSSRTLTSMSGRRVGIFCRGVRTGIEPVASIDDFRFCVFFVMPTTGDFFNFELTE